MRKRKNKGIALPGSSRRKWARRGRAVGDFLTSLLFSVSPLPRLYIGAAGGAQVVDSPRAYSLEVLFEARARF